MGSATVAWFAARYPEVPRAVILEDPNLGGPRPPAPPSAADPEKRMRDLLARNNRSEQELVAQCMKDNPKWGQSECEIWAPSKRRHHPKTALLSSAGRPPMKELFPKIAAPTLILKADAEGELRKTNEETARLLRNGSIIHIKGAGHNVRREGKADALEAVRAFLARLRS